jgi:hypothetical protein
VFRVYVCNTKQILITFAERRSEQSRTTERDTERERDTFERTNQRRFFLGYERSCRRISARIDALRTHRRIVFLAFGFFSRIIVAFAAKNTHK